MPVTGAHVRAIRGALDLSVPQLATVLGVHPSSVHRWESLGDNDARIEGVPLNVLLALQERVAEEPREDVREVGSSVARALMVGGVLAGLALILTFALRKD